ncbi:hypothetical protein BaRGS_00016661 [Batillaria attramentaria]|uniref:RING-type domain-containing protein n=1 Tax=Batillaria attramentaria TaxID=370345 RepID=A0ABD0KZ26_9CAEN
MRFRCLNWYFGFKAYLTMMHRRCHVIEPRPVTPKLCVTCHHRQAVVIFLPCSHMVTCLACANSKTSCSTCRRKIRGTVVAAPENDDMWRPDGQLEAA